MLGDTVTFERLSPDISKAFVSFFGLSRLRRGDFRYTRIFSFSFPFNTLFSFRVSNFRCTAILSMHFLIILFSQLRRGDFRYTTMLF